MSKFGPIRTWTHARRIARLAEIRDAMINLPPEDPTQGLGRLLYQGRLDEAVVIWLEVMREAFPDYPPMEMFKETIVDHLPADAGILGDIAMRFLETRGLVRRYKTADADGKAILRPALSARGML